MTKKHFEAIAKIMATFKESPSMPIIAYELANYFQRENPRFNRAKFLKACNVK